MTKRWIIINMIIIAAVVVLLLIWSGTSAKAEPTSHDLCYCAAVKPQESSIGVFQ